MYYRYITIVTRKLEEIENIKNIIVSSTENGCQDHSSMLDVYKRFDKYLDEENIVSQW